MSCPCLRETRRSSSCSACGTWRFAKSSTIRRRRSHANPVSVHAHTNNNMWGPQIGGLVDYGHQDVWLRFEGKAAICNNEDQSGTGGDRGWDRRHTPPPRQSCTAWVADINASILWRPTSALTAKIGYQALWVDQVALAARNFSTDVVR